MIKVVCKKDEYGTTRWYKEGTYILHREGGPAQEWSDGHKRWYQNGQLHRTDGPAIVYYDEYKEYWLHGKYYPDIKTDKEWIIFQIIN